ncbi:MAG: histidine kinase [Bacteroidota bacterium]
MSSPTAVPSRWLLRLAVVVFPLATLLPVGTLVMDWLEVSRLVGAPMEAAPPRGFDWARWSDRDGDIVAAYVDPRGTAYAAGLRPGDVLFTLDGMQYFNADDVERVVAGLPPGAAVAYSVTRSGVPIRLEVAITRYPTFLYPLSEALWQVSLWGFAIAAFLTVLALGIVAPLTVRSRRTWGAVTLLVAATVWAVGHGLRLSLLTVVGPPLEAGYTLVFRTITVVSLAGWIAFPAVLLFVVLGAVRDRVVRRLRWVVFVPSAVLMVGVLLDALVGEVGPVTMEALVAPTLFYVCCYVAVATGLSFLQAHGDEGDALPAVSLGWSRVGSLLVFFVAASGAFFALRGLPTADAVTDLRAGWLVVAVQVLSLMPVGLVTAATLRYGKTDVLPRGLTVAAGLGLVFFAFVGGLEGLRRLYDATPVPSLVVGLWLLLLLLGVGLLGRLFRDRLGSVLLTERQRARRRLDRFSERVRHLLAPQRLADETATEVGEALGVSSLAVFLRDVEVDGTDTGDDWLEGSFQRQPPYFDRSHLDVVLRSPGGPACVWTRNTELNERTLPPEVDAKLRALGLALAVPVVADASGAEPLGMLVLGTKRARRTVYSLDDVDQLKALAAQLALALERLRLVAREKALVRQRAEAQLTALRAQINPHFLFNALNTIAALIAERPVDAEANVERLARIFRHVLTTSGQPFVPLRDEVRLVGEYFALEQARFGNRLTVGVDVPDALLDHPVPAFAVQTLAENAVKHGIEKQRGGGSVTLRAHLDAAPDDLASGDGQVRDVLVVTISDTGVGLALPPPSSDPTAFYGVGLSNVRDRLRQLYGRDDLLQVVGAPGVGATATLRLPLSSTPAAPPIPTHG